MLVFGADPDMAMKPWVEEEPTNYVGPQVYRLVIYFGYHPPLRMFQRWTDEDRMIIATLMARRLDQGFAPQTLEKMVDRFYQTWAGDSDIPSKAFASEKMQVQLTQMAELLLADPVLDWLAAGMPTGPEFGIDLRKAVLALSSELTHRYPDVVASVVRENQGLEATATMLRAAERMVKWNLGEEDDPKVCRAVLSGIDLPKDLPVRRRGSLRSKGQTIVHAIGNIPRKKQHNEWERQGSFRQAITRTWD